MKRLLYFLFIVLFVSSSFAQYHGGAMHTSGNTGQLIEGNVIETFDSGGYTYLNVQTKDGTVWAATRPMALEKGDRVSFSPELPMRDFHSKSLDRTFKLIYFTSSVHRTGEGEAKTAPEKEKRPVDGTIVKGKTIADIIGHRKELSGKTVEFTGKVVKYLPEIMGKNWLHVQDGSGGETPADLTVTTTGTAGVGDEVKITGRVSVDMDFGYGYTYDVLIEDASVTVIKAADATKQQVVSGGMK